MSETPAFDYQRLPSYVSVEGSLYTVYAATWSEAHDEVELSLNPILTTKPSTLARGQKVEVIQSERVSHTGTVGSFAVHGPARPVELVVIGAIAC